jgi:hypothetical protein
MWKTIQIIFIVLAILLILGADWLSMDFLLHAGMGSFGFAAIATGCDAILTQHIVTGGRRGPRRTYTGIPAVLHGVQFIMLGLFLIGMGLILQFNGNGRGFFLQIVRHPGLALVAFGSIVLAQSVITLVGSREVQDGSTASLLLLRLLPGLILAVVGVAVTGLGLVEIVAPTLFDGMGGGFLEMLYGIR